MAPTVDLSSFSAGSAPSPGADETSASAASTGRAGAADGGLDAAGVSPSGGRRGSAVGLGGGDDGGGDDDDECIVTCTYTGTLALRELTVGLHGDYLEPSRPLIMITLGEISGTAVRYAEQCSPLDVQAGLAGGWLLSRQRRSGEVVTNLAGRLRLEAWYLNRHINQLEPLVEPWQCAFFHVSRELPRQVG